MASAEHGDTVSSPVQPAKTDDWADDFPSVPPSICGPPGGAMMFGNRNVGDSEFALMMELSLLDSAVGSYIEDGRGRPDPNDPDGLSKRFPRLLEGGGPSSSSSDAFTSAKLRTYKMKGGLEGEGLTIVSDPECREVSLADARWTSPFKPPTPSHFPLESTEWEDGGDMLVFGELSSITEKPSENQLSGDPPLLLGSSRQAAAESFDLLDLSCDDDLPDVFDEHGSSSALVGLGSGGNTHPMIRRAPPGFSSAAARISEDPMSEMSPCRSGGAPSLRGEGAASSGPPKRRIPASAVAAASHASRAQASRAQGSREVMAQSTMPEADDDPDQVIHFEPVYDELELDFLSTQDAVFRKTKPVPCRPAPKKVMVGACDEGGDCSMGSLVPDTAETAAAVGACFNESLICRMETNDGSRHRSVRSQPL